MARIIATTPVGVLTLRHNDARLTLDGTNNAVVLAWWQNFLLSSPFGMDGHSLNLDQCTKRDAVAALTAALDANAVTISTSFDPIASIPKDATP